MHPDYTLPPTNETCPGDLLRAAYAQTASQPPRTHGHDRPITPGNNSAIPINLFNGQGLTTPRNMVPALELDSSEPPAAQRVAQAAPRLAPQPVIEYPRPQDRQKREHSARALDQWLRETRESMSPAAAPIRGLVRPGWGSSVPSSASRGVQPGCARGSSWPSGEADQSCYSPACFGAVVTTRLDVGGTR
jgi:hypothetical protein